MKEAWERWRSRGDPSVVYEAQPVEGGVSGAETKVPGYEMRPLKGEVFITVDAETLERLYERMDEHGGS